MTLAIFDCLFLTISAVGLVIQSFKNGKYDAIHATLLLQPLMAPLIVKLVVNVLGINVSQYTTKMMADRSNEDSQIV